MTRRSTPAPKRIYSMEFPAPKGAEHAYALKAPAALWRQAQIKAAREQVSMRSVLLSLLTAYVGHDATR